MYLQFLLWQQFELNFSIKNDKKFSSQELRQSFSCFWKHVKILEEFLSY